MDYFIRSIKAAAPSLIVALAVITAGLPPVAQAAGQAGNAQTNNEERRKIGEANDFKLKGQDPLYAQQAKALAEQYRETAEIVARQGGNAQPILDAAAHLDSQSEVISKARQSKHLPLQVPEVAPHLGHKHK
jgi:hypothetical protein